MNPNPNTNTETTTPAAAPAAAEPQTMIPAYSVRFTVEKANGAGRAEFSREFTTAERARVFAGELREDLARRAEFPPECSRIVEVSGPFWAPVFFAGAPEEINPEQINPAYGPRRK